MRRTTSVCATMKNGESVASFSRALVERVVKGAGLDASSQAVQVAVA